MTKKATGGWLFKEEPTHYSYSDLEKDQEALWDGVDNALARQNLRKVKAGDRVLYYHTGKERQIVGEMRVLSDPTADPTSDDPKSVVVKVAPVRRWQTPLGLDRIKQDTMLKSWDLVRLPRLSVMPVSAEQWQRLEKLGEQEAT